MQERPDLPPSVRCCCLNAYSSSEEFVAALLPDQHWTNSLNLLLAMLVTWPARACRSCFYRFRGFAAGTLSYMASRSGASWPLVSGKHGSKTHQTSEGLRVAARLSAHSVSERAAAHSVRQRGSRGRNSRRWTRRRGSGVVWSDDDLGLRRASPRSQLVSSPPRAGVHHFDSWPYRPRARALTDAAGGATTTGRSKVTAEHRPNNGFGAATTPQAQGPDSRHIRNPAIQGRLNSSRQRARWPLPPMIEARTTDTGQRW